MLSSYLFILPIILLLTANLGANTHNDELEKLKANYKNSLLFVGEEKLIEHLIQFPEEEHVSDQMAIELMERYPIANTIVEGLLNSQSNQDGSWSDIDYTSNARSGWKPKIHVENILKLARVYNTVGNCYYQSEQVENAIHLGLKYWFDTKLVCPNWWYNQIGVPKLMGAIALLMENKLTLDEKEKAIIVLANAKFGMTGQNKVWLAGNVLVRALLQADLELVKAAQKQIFDEIKIGTGKNEGIKSDWSYHQHGAQQQFGNYGAAFLATTSFWAKVFSETSLALDQPRLDLLSDLIINGFDRILWRGMMDVNGLGRQLYKQAQTHKAYSVCFSANILASIDAKNRNGYETFINANIISPLADVQNTGLYHFWQSEQTINRTTKWMTSLKMSSKRVIGAESGNGDNKKGYYLGHGALYTYISGTEYYDIYPVWDWRKIPGTTAHQTDKPLKELGWLEGSNNSDFVGNVNDGTYGLTVLDLDKDRLKAKKTWIFTPSYTLCLGADIQSDSLCSVSTTIEQKLQDDDLFYLTPRHKWMPIEGTSNVTVANQRYHHHNVGYIVLGSSQTTVSAESRTGSWFDIMGTYPNIESEKDTRDVVSIYINHGDQPNDGEYKYLILPMADQSAVENFDIKSIQILRNDSIQQIVNLTKENKAFVSSRIPVDTILDGTIFKTSTSGLFMLSYHNGKWSAIAADPTHKLGKTTVILGDKSYEVNFPQGENKGKSVMVQ